MLFGVPMFITYSHGNAEIERTLSVVEAAFERMETAHLAGDVASQLEGTPPGVVFRTHG